MKAYFIFLFLFFAVACARVSSTGNVISISNERQKAANDASPTPAATINSQSTECSAADGYCLGVVEDTAREAKNVNIIVGGKIKWVVKLPSPLDQNGYALNWAKKTNVGFEISIEYGSRYYFNKSFIFLKKDETFYLTEIKIESFDKQKSETTTTKTVRVKPPVAVEKFNIEDYMQD